MKKLKFKSTSVLNLLVTVFASCTILFVFIFAIILSIIVGDTADNILALKIFGVILIAVWVIYFTLNFIVYKTVVVTEDTITFKRWKKIIWTLNKADILECVYILSYDFLGANSMRMKFIMKDTKDYAEYTFCKYFFYSGITMSYKNAKKIAEMGYNVRFDV